MERLESIRTITWESSSVLSLQLLGNNKLASASEDGSIKIWNVHSGECIRILSDNSDGVFHWNY